jgi:hypothetical protein
MKKYFSILLCIMLCLFWNIHPVSSIEDRVQPRKPEGRWLGSWLGVVGDNVRGTAWTGTASEDDTGVFVSAELYKDSHSMGYADDYDDEYAWVYVEAYNPSGNQFWELWAYHYWYGAFPSGCWSYKSGYF